MRRCAAARVLCASASEAVVSTWLGLHMEHRRSIIGITVCCDVLLSSLPPRRPPPAVLCGGVASRSCPQAPDPGGASATVL